MQKSMMQQSSVISVPSPHDSIHNPFVGVELGRSQDSLTFGESMQSLAPSMLTQSLQTMPTHAMDLNIAAIQEASRHLRSGSQSNAADLVSQKSTSSETKPANAAMHLLQKGSFIGNTSDLPGSPSSPFVPKDSLLSIFSSSNQNQVKANDTPMMASVSSMEPQFNADSVHNSSTLSMMGGSDMDRLQQMVFFNLCSTWKVKKNYKYARETWK